MMLPRPYARLRYRLPALLRVWIGTEVRPHTISIRILIEYNSSSSLLT